MTAAIYRVHVLGFGVGSIAGSPDYLGSDLSSCSNAIEKILRYITHHVTTLIILFNILYFDW